MIFRDCQILDATGPAGVFGVANQIAAKLGIKRALYDIHLIAPCSGPIRTNAGISLHATKSLFDKHSPYDTIICAGGFGTQTLITDAASINRIRDLCARADRIVSVCTGAFILAEAGILAKRQATTHWAHCDALAKAYPEITVLSDPIFVKDGNVYSSAGITAGMDLSLALVEADHGREMAMASARDLVMFMKRPGNQAQFSMHLEAQMASSGGVRDAQVWVLENLGDKIDVELMAAQANMSLRSFNRRFKDETGLSPARFVVECRVEAARRILEESDMQIKTIAVKTGFGDEERMRRAFKRHMGVSPDNYRQCFSKTPFQHVEIVS